MVTPLAGTRSSGCVLTPDEQSLVFTTGDEVRRVPVGGGPSVPIAGSFFGSGFADGPAAAAHFRWPQGVVIGEDGAIFVADSGNHRIRRIMGDNVTTFAGSGVAGFADGAGAAASFTYPSGLALGPGGVLYVTEAGGHHVRMISPAGAVTTLAGSRERGFADGRGAAARFDEPTGIAVDAAGVVFVADDGNHCIRRITNGVVDTLAGNVTYGFNDGVGAAARFNHPRGLALDPITGNLLVTDRGNQRIRSVDPRTGTVTTLPIGGGAGHARPAIGAPPLDAALLDLSSLAAITVDRNGSLYLGMYAGIVRMYNARRIREQARDVKNALLAGLLPDIRRPENVKKNLEQPIDRNRAVYEALDSGAVTANLAEFLAGPSGKPERGLLQDTGAVLTHLENQHQGRAEVGSRLTAPARPLPWPSIPVPPPRWWQRRYWTQRGGRSRKTRRRMKNPCWKGYTAYGMKKGGPNCVPIKSRHQRRRV